MTRPIPRTSARLAAAALLMLAGCAGEDASPEPRSAAAVCRDMAALHAGAQRSAFALDLAAAEAALRGVLVLHDSGAACPGQPSRAITLAELGLALSGQRRFRLADAAFEEARAALVARPADSPAAVERAAVEEGRIGVLEGQHLLNRREVDRAAQRTRLAVSRLGLGAGAAGAVEPFELGTLFDLAEEERGRRLSGVSGSFGLAAASARGGDLDEARRSIEAAADLAASLPGASSAVRSRIQTERALVEIEAGRFDEAARFAGEAAAQLALELPGTPLAGRARLIEGAALARAGRREAALAAFDAAFAAYEETPAGLQYESVWPFVALLLAEEAAGRRTPEATAASVFRAAQLVRSSAAAADIAASATLAAAGEGSGPAAIRAWRDAQEELALISTALSRQDLQGFEREALNRRFVDAAEREAALRARRDAVAPEFRRAIETPATLAELQAALRPGEALIQVLVGDPRSVAIAITPDSARVVATDLTATLAGVVAEVLRAPMRAGPDGRYPGFAPGVAWLAQPLILGDLAPSLAAQQRVFVVAGGPLLGVPFELLLTQDPAAQEAAVAEGDYGGLAWLGAATTLSYLPAARNLVDLRRPGGGSAAAGAVIGFGDFDPGPDASAGVDQRRRERCAAEVAAVGRLQPLPGTRTELDSIAALLPGSERVEGAAFTEGAVKTLSESGRLRDFRVAHFATHGLLWPTTDCFEPALSATPRPDAGEDGLLESSEIRVLDLDARLVVLSACASTDPLVGESGENLSGLARAFFTAGARAVIASHWDVSDAATAALMADLYRRIAADRTLAFSEALAQAQAALRGDRATSHPAFWAPFVLIGDGALALDG